MFQLYPLKARLAVYVLILVLVTTLFRLDVYALESSPVQSVENRESIQVLLPLLIRIISAVEVKDFEKEVVVLTNQERMANGCGPVAMDSRLQLAAVRHSEDMAVNDFFSHIAPDGTSPWDRIHAQGYSFSLAGENIAAGYSSPESVVSGWMKSPGHRANILNCGFVHIGVGYYNLPNDPGNVKYQHYWTQVLAAP